MLVAESLHSGRAQRVALVTGASGGIGAHVVEQLSAAGYAVIAHYHANGAAAARAQEEARAAGRDVVALHANLSDAKELKQMIATIEARYPAIECLIHAAAPPVGTAPPLETSDDDFVRHLGVQAASFAALARATLPLMQRQQRGVILGILSTVVEPSRPKGWWPYTAAKFAALGLLAGLATDVEGSGVRVVGVMPTGVAGTLSKEAGLSQERLLQASEVAALIVRIVGEAQPFPNGCLAKIEPSGVSVGRLVFQGTPLQSRAPNSCL